MKKYGFVAFLLLFLLLLPGLTQAAGKETHINLDGRALSLSKDEQVKTISNTVMVPLRLITEELGYKVTWANKTQTVTIEQGGTTLKLIVGSKTAQVNGKEVKMLAAPMLSGSSSTKTTFVPLRFIGEQTGADVKWDSDAKTVYVKSAAALSGNGDVSVPGKGSAGSSQGSTVPAPGGGSEITPATNQPSTSTSASLKNLSFSENRLILAVEGSVTPKVFKMTGPDRIVVDLANTSFAANFDSGLPLDSSLTGQIGIEEYPDVKDVRYSLFSSNPSTIRVVLDLTKAVNYSVVDNKDGLIIIDLNTSEAEPSQGEGKEGQRLVVIDAGHGGSDPGAGSITNRNEKEFTLAVALKVQKLLEQESWLDVVMTRDDDTYPTLQKRVKLANDLNADVFVSIHGNKVDANPIPNGVETHYTNKNSQNLARIMQKYMLEATGLKDRGLKPGNLYVTKNTKMPAVLLECGFLSNPTDEKAMYTEEFQQSLAEGIVAGLKEFFGQ
ncbi:N-acetylmuramoyl-L-alanine amidase [Paenibacillus sp. CAA11]|uniref:N-acetylmuramoyl-L-alanine amidase family protein n=1 Tax=Paenibacillus sp. CAA11 TaxID=1532905 RepID=UPI000D3B29BC|nr:N-acetylmuramoyl-L-alanine amidase family protein [Paenibacillus sp. CAA11]AWB44942.1 N-acetylmuramoyl-L-alanine amidase [Paenibacillus sp. CAA11]